MRLKFLISLFFTVFVYACAKDQASQGSQETLSQDQGESAGGQNGSEKNNQASANSGDQTPASLPGSDQSETDVDTVSNGALDAAPEGTGASAGAETETSDPGASLGDALPPVTEAAPQGQAPEESATTQVPEVPTPQDSPSRAGTGRMVRYVIRDDTAIVLEPQAGAKEVGSLSKGDSVLVEDQGEYAKIGEGKFVAKEALSEKIISRTTTSNPWK